ncbi:hypothetical protein MJO29_010650 [Puccinia striiformis f. sp. tritici]|nr:hypothetical protein MJO29_010650 [Puccinia striiformis f. sp. tritici]
MKSAAENNNNNNIIATQQHQQQQQHQQHQHQQHQNQTEEKQKEEAAEETAGRNEQLRQYQQQQQHHQHHHHQHQHQHLETEHQHIFHQHQLKLKQQQQQQQLNINNSISIPTTTTTDNNNICQVKRKFNATLEQKIFILDWHHANGKKQTKTAAYFTSLDGWPTITQPLISNWLKDEEKIRANLKLATPDTKRLRIVRHPEVEKALSVWCNQSIAENLQLGCDLIKIKALEFAIGFGLDQAEFSKSSTCWIDRFLDRQGTRTIKTHQAENFSQASVEAERQRLKSVLAYYPPHDVWTLDETSLYYTMPPDRSIPSERWRSDQRLLTFGLCVNSDGSQRRPPWIIGKNSIHPKNLKTKSNTHNNDHQGFDYSSNPKASLTAEVFIKWMSNWQKELNKQNRKILLILDNNPGHIIEVDLYSNIRVEFISSNISALLQPLDQGIFRVWKAHYRRLYLERAIGLYEAKSPNIYQIDQVQAMQLATTAWTNFVPADNILSCWRHALLIQDSTSSAFNGFAGPVRDKGVGQAESELSKVIDTLVELSLLNTSNRIPIDEFTDPPFERVVTLQKYSDQEIISLIRNEDAANNRDEDESQQQQQQQQQQPSLEEVPSKDEKPSIPVPANLAPINGHHRPPPPQVSSTTQNRAPPPPQQQQQQINQNLIDGAHHPIFNHHPHHHPHHHHLQHFQHPSHPNLILHPSHTMLPLHNPPPTNHNLNTGSLPYNIPNNNNPHQQAVSGSSCLQQPKSNDESIIINHHHSTTSRKPEVWSVPQVLDALEEISRFSMHRREPEWKEVPHMLARMARALKSELAHTTTTTTAGFNNGYPHLQSPLLSSSSTTTTSSSSRVHPQTLNPATQSPHSISNNSHPLSNNPSQIAQLPLSPHLHHHQHPHPSHPSHPHPHPSSRPQSQPLTHSQSHPPSTTSHSQLLHSNHVQVQAQQQQHLSQLHHQHHHHQQQQALSSGPAPPLQKSNHQPITHNNTPRPQSSHSPCGTHTNSSNLTNIHHPHPSTPSSTSITPSSQSITPSRSNPVPTAASTSAAPTALSISAAAAASVADIVTTHTSTATSTTTTTGQAQSQGQGQVTNHLSIDKITNPVDVGNSN